MPTRSCYREPDAAGFSQRPARGFEAIDLNKRRRCSRLERANGLGAARNAAVRVHVYALEFSRHLQRLACDLQLGL